MKGSLRCGQWLLAGMMVMALTIAFGQHFYTQPELQAGRVARQTITAPSNGTIEHIAETEQQRQAARQISPVLVLDSGKTEHDRQQLRRALREGHQRRQMMGTAIDQTNAIATLKAQRPRPQDFAARYAKMTRTQQIYRQAIAALTDPVLAESGYFYPPSLFSLSNPDWQTIEQQLPPMAERILAQGIAIGLPAATQTHAFQLHSQILPPATRSLSADLLRHTLQPNLVPDPERTQILALAAAQQVAPVMIQIEAGAVIAQINQPITTTQAIWLEHFNLDRRTIALPKLMLFAGYVSLVVGGWCLIMRFLKITLKAQDYLLIGLLALSTALLVHLHVPSTNLPMLGLLLSIFYRPALSVPTILAVGLLLPIGLNVGLHSWITSLLGGLFAAGYSSRIRSREDSVLLGASVGGLQAIGYLILGSINQVPWQTAVGGATIYGLLGLAWCVVGLGISPYLEHFFDVVTTLRLVELANLNRPLLKRLAAETPGTFQHTLAVANLAEAAARELGCNVELVRTGTLYHDIGKMHDPLGFIENQMGGSNKHDALQDPWQSAAIIRHHITEGIVMARRARLPKAVQAFIPEHQGAGLITYFYHQAQLQVAADPSRTIDGTIDDRDFRYAGPNPQSRETGIVMLADSCEAALRSLATNQNASSSIEQAANMIQKIFRARWQEGTLASSGLTRGDLDRIAAIFLQVWQQSNHRRIAYPK
jgi:cyclic-di-AMP phosphodiesterase PgpH